MLAGLLRDYPGVSLYRTTKRTVIALYDGYRKALVPYDVAVLAIAPGYVATANSTVATPAHIWGQTDLPRV